LFPFFRRLTSIRNKGECSVTLLKIAGIIEHVFNAISSLMFILVRLRHIALPLFSKRSGNSFANAAAL